MGSYQSLLAQEKPDFVGIYVIAICRCRHFVLFLSCWLASITIWFAESICSSFGFDRCLSRQAMSGKS
jgi:hypothetical protein